MGTAFFFKAVLLNTTTRPLHSVPHLHNVYNISCTLNLYNRSQSVCFRADIAHNCQNFVTEPTGGTRRAPASIFSCYSADNAEKSVPDSHFVLSTQLNTLATISEGLANSSVLNQCFVVPCATRTGVAIYMLPTPHRQRRVGAGVVYPCVSHGWLCGPGVGCALCSLLRFLSHENGKLQNPYELQ